MNNDNIMPEHHSHLVEGIEQSEKKRKLILRVVVVFLILIFLAGMAVGAVSIINEDTEPETAFTAVPETDEQAVAYYAEMLTLLGDETRTKLSVDTWLGVPDKSVFAGDNAMLSDALVYVRSQMLDKLKTFYGEYKSAYDESYDEKLLPADFTVSDLSALEYKENDGGDKTQLDFTFKDEEYPCGDGSVIAKCFDISRVEDFRAYAENELSSVLDVSSCDISCSGFRITSESDEKTDRFSNITYIRSYEVNASVMFKGEWGELGEQSISFTFEVHESYNFTWAGIRLSPQMLKIEKGDTAEISAYRTTDEDVIVEWTSSAPEVVSVDAEGYIKAHKVSETPVIITGTFTYRGMVFTDSCEVYVIVPAERLVLSEKEAVLSVGDTYTLNAQVKPEKSTIKAINWGSTDESIVTVDENGVITAISSGSASVYAYSVDGRHKKTCEVTVK